jgi:ABC-type Fe3+-hydroxamate transport system substrate-binding protein
MRFVLAALLALVLAGCGSDETSNDAASTTPPATVTVTETETVPAEPEVTCSTAGLRLTLPEQELPAEVADVRKRIFDAAVACDYDTLEEIALEKGAGFTFTYGAETDASDY